ncbi:hypothetical protein P20439_0483 [Pseudoalteromonas sp. BSi20439]|jgi:hypothetical protein|nr:hypothetical protein P20439_0483 [Pseudoalteromonas sp. BSi20439]|tara:strand:- start:318 stop:452 length:135 start_codon:yes stop_codon:yes gene_type:complete
MSAVAAAVAALACGMNIKKSWLRGKNTMVKMSTVSQFNSIIENN